MSSNLSRLDRISTVFVAVVGFAPVLMVYLGLIARA
jgi:hypothetical protein